MNRELNLKSGLIAIAMVLVLVAGVMVLMPNKQASDDTVSLCDKLRQVALADCTSGYEERFNDEGGYVYSRREQLKDYRVCNKLADNIQDDCKKSY